MAIQNGVGAFAAHAGITAAIAIANIGAAFGTAKAGVGICVPIIMAGILGVYGMIVSVILLKNVDWNSTNFNFQKAYAKMGAGLACGFSSLAAGYAIGLVGDIGVRMNSQQPKLFVGMLLILIFAEALGLYGMIVAILVANK